MPQLGSGVFRNYKIARKKQSLFIQVAILGLRLAISIRLTVLTATSTRPLDWEK